MKRNSLLSVIFSVMYLSDIDDVNPKDWFTRDIAKCCGLSHLRRRSLRATLPRFHVPALEKV